MPAFGRHDKRGFWFGNLPPPNTGLLDPEHGQVGLETALVVGVPLVGHSVGDWVDHIDLKEVRRHCISVV